MIKILIVDDIQTNANLLKFTIQDYFEDAEIFEYRIDIAVNGWEAVGMAYVNRYDILFLDVMMPKYDGYEVLNTIRVIKKREHQPYICMVTGVSDKEQIELFKKKGANSYVIKPYESSKIVKILDSSIKLIASKPQEEDSAMLSGLLNIGGDEESIHIAFDDFYE